MDNQSNSTVKPAINPIINPIVTDDLQKVCPFLGRECIEKRCMMWIRIERQGISPTLGVHQKQVVYVCSLVDKTPMLIPIPVRAG